MRSDSCGLDFGTSNSTVGWSQPGAPALLALEGDKVTLPSAVFFHAEDLPASYGRAAMADYLAGHDGRLMRSLKSLLGTAMMDDYTDVAGQALAFRRILEQFIGELKRRAEFASGQVFNRVVLGRPVFFVDDNAQADRLAEQTLAEIARAVGFTDVAFQFEPIAAAFDYELRVTREALVLVVDIGGGTSDFSLVRLSPERSAKADRRSDILASGGIHIGGTDFDRALSLASVMPVLGMGSALTSGRHMPSTPFFNLATWHTINMAYSRKSLADIQDMHRHAADKEKTARLARLVEQRAGHWLALQVETAKIALTTHTTTALELGRIAPNESHTIGRYNFDDAIDHLVGSIATTVQNLLGNAGVQASAVDTVLFTGGSSSVTLLRERIRALLPDAQCVEGDLFGGIGAGLALDAQRVFG